MNDKEIYDLTYSAALETVKTGAPGLKEATIQAIAIRIAIKLTHEIGRRLAVEKASNYES